MYLKYLINFTGATDSAVPCAMMLTMAYVLRNYLETNKLNNEITLKYVFFDGEEAFLQWTATDSIYGARHLAEKWENENVLSKIVRNNNSLSFCEYISKLKISRTC